MERSTTEIVYEFIRDYIERVGVAPSIREIADGCFISRASAHYHLSRLDAWGWVMVLPGTARGIVLLEPQKGRAKQRLPVHEDPERERG
jgi:SOS-response transcriptional repressor LexA